MDSKARIAAAVAAGYLLGRTKRLKLAIMVGGLIAGQKIPTNPRDLARELQRIVEGNEQLSAMSNQVRGELTDAAKTAAAQAVTGRLEHLSGNLRGEPDEEEPDEEEPDEEEPESRADSAEAGSGPAKKTAKKRPAKKAAKKAPAKKTATSTAKKTAKKAPAKKAAKKAPAKKAPAKKTSSSRARKRS